MSSSFNIDTVGFGAFAVGVGAIQSAAEDAMLKVGIEALAYAKANAPWADRTGDARQGLDVNVSSELGQVVLELFHTVDYGLWLETIQDGRYAIIMPTLELFAAQAFASAGARVESELSG